MKVDMPGTTRFPNLLAPIRFGSLELENRIIFGPHETRLESNHEAYAAYMGARAQGGVGLVITTITSVHESGYMGRGLPKLHSDEDIDSVTRQVAAARRSGAKVILQMGHLGLQIGAFRPDGSRRTPWGASFGRALVPARNVAGQEMAVALISEVVAAHGAAAARAKAAGADGIELYASHDGLLASFLAERVNRRQDDYGVTPEGRFRIVRETVEAIRKAVGRDFPLGIRVSGDDCDNVGLDPSEAPAICEMIDRLNLVDYLHVARGGEGTRRGILAAIAPMTYADGSGADYCRAIKARVRTPVIANGRINQPQVAEAILARGDADAICLVRPLICDSQYVAKVKTGRPEEIRACIACNQACVGHLSVGASVNCIQSPESGRELQFAQSTPASVARRLLVVGGGPGGLKTAIEAAKRGHQVRLCEATSRLGGQVLLAQLLPDRADYGTAVTNLTGELGRLPVEVLLNTKVGRADIAAFAPDVVVIATGGRPWSPSLDHDGEIPILSAWSVLRDPSKAGRRVVVADYIGDWVAPGVAEILAKSGCEVSVVTIHPRLGEGISFGGDEAAGRMYGLGISITPYARLIGTAERTVYFEHVMALQPIEFDGIDTLIVSAGAESDRSLMDEIKGLNIDTRMVGDCAAPRTIEEAILEGFQAGRDL